jgi:hypothetical protein
VQGEATLNIIEKTEPLICFLDANNKFEKPLITTRNVIPKIWS